MLWARDKSPTSRDCSELLIEKMYESEFAGRKVKFLLKTWRLRQYKITPPLFGTPQGLRLLDELKSTDA